MESARLLTYKAAALKDNKKPYTKVNIMDPSKDQQQKIYI